LLEDCPAEAEEVAWLVDDVCDWLVEVGEEVELRAKYPPTAATMTMTTITAATVVLIALRPLGGTAGVCLDSRPL
jgi:hypothetical protein